ncbi:MAG: glycosyltransferase [Gemmatimonadota bacterium]
MNSPPRSIGATPTIRPRSQRLKILVVAPQPFYEERGTPIATRRLVRCLTSEGHAVDVLTYPIGREMSLAPARTFRSPGLPGINEVPVGLSWRKIALDVPLVTAIARRAKPGAYDVVHAVEEAIFPALVLRRRHGAKVVYDMDSSLSASILEGHWAFRAFASPIRWLENWAVRASDLVLAVSDDLVDFARSHAHSADRVHVLRDTPVDEEPTGETPDDIRGAFPHAHTLALYVGNLVSYQGIDLLVDAAERLPAGSGIGIAVIGGTDVRVASFRDQVRQRGLTDRIHFFGRRPLGDLALYLAQADVLVSPRTRGGNTPLKIYSYMAAGRAIAATRLSTHTEVLDDTTAALFEPDGEALATTLEGLARDEVGRQRLGAAARARAEERYSAEAYVCSLRNAYASLQSVLLAALILL